MRTVGRRCHELRIPDESQTWRIIYRIDPDAVVILEVFSKKAQQTPQRVIDTCQARLSRYDQVSGG
jgi:phage-related protein